MLVTSPLSIQTKNLNSVFDVHLCPTPTLKKEPPPLEYKIFFVTDPHEVPQSDSKPTFPSSTGQVIKLSLRLSQLLLQGEYFTFVRVLVTRRRFQQEQVSQDREFRFVDHLFRFGNRT